MYYKKFHLKPLVVFSNRYMKAAVSKRLASTVLYDNNHHNASCTKTDQPFLFP